MKEKRLFVNVFVIALVFTLVGGIRLGFAQEPLEMGEDPVNPEVEASTAGYIVSPTISYQGKLIEGGVPFDGTASMTFGLWTMQAGGSLVWSEGPKSVPVDNGLFHVVLGDTTALPVDRFDQELWLEIDVKGTTLPRQKLMGAPFAFSLAPGAQVTGSIAGDYVLEVANAGDGPALIGASSTRTGLTGSSLLRHGVYASSLGIGLDGAAMYAKNTNINGISLWAHNDNSSSSDTTLAVSNDGSGDLIKGFGGDGGEDEFAVHNDGTIETKADSYIFIPASTFVVVDSADPPKTLALGNGVLIVNGDHIGEHQHWINIPITIPNVLYGQDVEVKSITIYYECEDGTKGFIDATGLYMQQMMSFDTLIYDDVDRTSDTANAYTFVVNHTLATNQGLNLVLTFEFNDLENQVAIGGVLVELGHHHLY